MWDESINENPSHWDDINEAVKAVKNKVLQANHGYIDGNPVLFHCVLDASRFGLTEEKAKDQDMFDEYAVVSNKGANAGILIYVKTDNGNWQVNTWSARFLVRVLLEDIGISIPNNTE